MGKKLSICVTHYKEDWETCQWLFASIAEQRGVDWRQIEVVVVNDGAEAPLLRKDFGDRYPYEVKILTKDKGGVSAARNYAIDNAEGEYVMICDCDDMFIYHYGLHLIFNAMASDPDTIQSTFIEELFLDGEYSILPHQQDGTFVHGKVHKKAFLAENNIRFADELTIHEDAYFHLFVNLFAKKREYINTPFYLWRWNDRSVVRSDLDRYQLKTYDHLMKGRAFTCRELKKRGLMSEYYEAVLKSVLDAYYDFQKPEYKNKANKEIVAKAEQAFRQFYVEFQKDFKDAPKEKLKEYAQCERTLAYSNGLILESETLVEWLTHIAKDVKSVKVW